MAQIACKYHNERPAKWFCEKCVIYFCASCIPKRAKLMEVKCPVCHELVTAVDTENSIDSFWNRLPSFFLYPVSLSSFLFLIILSITSIGIDYDPLLAISIPIIVTLFFLRYAYIALEQTAKGHMSIPPFSIDVLLNELDLPLKQILILVAAFAVNFTVYDLFGWGLFVFTIVFTIIASPASIMVLATEKSFFKAFNPLIVSKLISRIGKPYFILCGFLTLLMLSSEVSFSVLSTFIPVKFIWPGYFFINMYFVLIMYNLMGYVIFQYHEKLSFEIDVELDHLHTAFDTEQDQNKHESIIQAEILLKEGKVDLALENLSTATKNTPADFTIREMSHKLLKVTGRSDELLEHSSQYIDRLLINKKYAKAIDILIETREIVANYLPDKAKNRYELALLLKDQNYSDVALACVNNLHRDFPGYEGIPKAYFLAAKIMCESLGDDEKAIKVLEYVLNNYSVNELEQEMLDYIKMIKRLKNSSSE